MILQLLKKGMVVQAPESEVWPELETESLRPTM